MVFIKVKVKINQLTLNKYGRKTTLQKPRNITNNHVLMTTTTQTTIILSMSLSNTTPIVMIGSIRKNSNPQKGLMKAKLNSNIFPKLQHHLSHLNLKLI